MKTASQLDMEILGLIQKGIDFPVDESVFNKLALDIFEYQYASNEPYQFYCSKMNKHPRNIHSWEEIPAVPTVAFKEAALSCFPSEKSNKVFHTSGTTQEKPGKHYFDTTSLYDASIVDNFRKHLLPDLAFIPILSLTPSPSEAPNSSLVYMIHLAMELFGTKESRYFIQKNKLELDEFVRILKSFEKTGRPVFIIGTAISFVHLFDFCNHKSLLFHLPAGSRVMETGGFKGIAREISKDDLYKLFSTILGIPDEFCINEYGMTEMGTQYYDNKLRNHIEKKNASSYKVIPPWAKVRVIDPETMEEVKPGAQGLLLHLDLTNRGSVISILTEDIGIRLDNGFEILGRIPKAVPRGCSISVDEIASIQ